jgi:hypothetical protein
MSGNNSKFLAVASPKNGDKQIKVISPLASLDRLGPAYNIISVLDRRIVTFLKIGGKETSIRSALADKDVARKMAILTFFNNRSTFNLQWYPETGTNDIQIIEGLSHSDLPAVVEDLVNAGFGKQEAKPQNLSKQDVNSNGLSLKTGDNTLKLTS